MINQVIHAVDDLPAAAEAAASTAKDSGVSLYLSKIRSKEDIKQSGEKDYHMISHGFIPADQEKIAAMAELDVIDGVVFRVDGDGARHGRLRLASPARRCHHGCHHVRASQDR